MRDDKIGKPNPQNPDIVREATTYQNYLDKYALYRSDPALRKVHQKFPMVMLWDDHEVQDNYAGEPGRRRPAAGQALQRRAQGRRLQGLLRIDAALRHRTSASTARCSFGATMDLIVMDQRRYRANQPCDDAVAPPCADWDQPRDFLGQTQMKYVQDQLKPRRPPGRCMANEVTIMPTKVLGGSFFTYDTWQGYPQEREQLTTFIRDNNIADVIFLTGDIHTFITGDVRTNMGDGDTVAIELVGGSITSQGLGETDIDAGGGVTLKGNDQQPAHRPGDHRGAARHQPVGEGRGLRPSRLRQGHGVADELRLQLVRLETIKKRSKATLAPGSDYAREHRPRPEVALQLGGTSMHRSIAALAVAGATIAASAVAFAADDGRIGPSLRIVNNGRHLTPYGRLVNVGNVPTGGALTPDGRFYWTVSAGSGFNDVRIVSVKSAKVVQTIPLPGASGGVVIDRKGKRAYVSGLANSTNLETSRPNLPGGTGDVIHVFGISSSGKATETGQLPVPAPADADPPNDFPLPAAKKIGYPEFLDVSPNGKTLVVPLNLANRAAIVDIKSKRSATRRSAATPTPPPFCPTAAARS